jgi:hypothetical protein
MKPLTEMRTRKLPEGKVRLEGLCQLKNPMTLPGTELATFRAAGRIMSIEKFNDLIGNRTCDLLSGWKDHVN